MWAENDFGSLSDTKIYEKVRIFFFEKVQGCAASKGSGENDIKFQ